MLCTSCRERLPDPRGTGGALSGLPDAERLAEVLCIRCAALLPPIDSTEGLLRRLSALARFGLGAETAPLLGG